MGFEGRSSYECSAGTESELTHSVTYQPISHTIQKKQKLTCILLPFSTHVSKVLMSYKIAFLFERHGFAVCAT